MEFDLKSIQSFLSTIKVSRSMDHCSPNYHTHVNMVAPYGKFVMDISIIEKFWELYCAYSKSGINGLGLAEKPTQYIPVLVDFDIKVESTYQLPLYGKDEINQIVKIFNDCLRSLIKLQDHELTCFVLTKPAYTTTVNGIQYIKNGFHLHYPYIFLEKKDHHLYIVPTIKKRLLQCDVFKNIGVSDCSVLYDTQYYNVPWLMYGSHKPDNMPYKLDYILNSSLNEISLSDALSQYKVYNSGEKHIDIHNNYEFYLPRILSTNPFHRKTHVIKQSVELAITERIKPVSKVIVSELTKEQVDKNIRQATKLIPLISPRRSYSRIEWMTVGWALYNIGSGSREALELWIEFSKLCPKKFSESVCVYEWEHMEVRNVTIATLVFYAKNDNPELYRKNILTTNMDNLDIQDTHAEIAQRMFELYSSEFVCASIKDNIWYKYENHHWKRTDGAVDLRMKVSTEIVDTYQREYRELKAKYADADDRKDEKMLQQTIKTMNTLLKNLKTHPFKANVIKECADLFYNPIFLDKLDTNRFLFGFQNGVYDLKENKLRDGIPEDYISTQSPLEFKEFMETSGEVLEVYDCLRKIFPDKEIYNFFLDTTSEVFVGGNDRKLVLFWSGEGNNGKSVIQSFMEQILGNGKYCIKFSTSLITGKRAQSNACTPELARACNGVRWAVLQEPSQTESINMGMLKELSGNDSFYARGLYKDGREIAPMFKLVVICNEQPRIPHIDQATINRLCVIPFESKFCDGMKHVAPDTEEEQILQKKFPMIKNYIMDHVPRLASAFLWVLLNHRTKPKCDSIPVKVKIATDRYVQRNDFYRQFIEESLVKDNEGRIHISELYAIYKEWIKNSLTNYSVPNRIEVQDYFDSLWGLSVTGTWTGFRLKMGNEDQNNKPPL